MYANMGYHAGSGVEQPYVNIGNSQSDDVRFIYLKKILLDWRPTELERPVLSLTCLRKEYFLFIYCFFYKTHAEIQHRCSWHLHH